MRFDEIERNLAYAGRIREGGEATTTSEHHHEDSVKSICPQTCSGPFKVFYHGRWYQRGNDRLYRRIPSSNATEQHYLHRQIWIDSRYVLFEDAVRIPKDHEIHHVDLNRLNNHSWNLSALPVTEHRALHWDIEVGKRQPGSSTASRCTACPMNSPAM